MQRKSEVNISAVDFLLAAEDVAKRADISERIDTIVKQIKSKVDEGSGLRRSESTAVRNDHRLNPSGGFEFDLQPFEIFLTSRAADRLFSVDQDTAHLLLSALFELAANKSSKIVNDEITPQNFNIFTA